MGSALTLTLAVPAVALADMSTDPSAAPDKAGEDQCPKTCGEQSNTPDAPGTTRQEVRQAAEQDSAQSNYQLGSNGQPEGNVPSHPYSQSHYQLGAGHQD